MQKVVLNSNNKKNKDNTVFKMPVKLENAFFIKISRVDYMNQNGKSEYNKSYLLHDRIHYLVYP